MMPEDKPTIIPAQERPSRADALKNRELLLETAATLFHRKGVQNVTMSEVAEEAGVGKGTLYRHFSNKTELCNALLDQEQRDLQTRTLLRLRDRTESPQVQLRWFLEQVATFVTHNLELLSSVGDINAPLSLDMPAHRWWRQTIRALLTRCGSVNEIDYFTDTLYVMVDANTIRFQTDSRNLTLPDIVRGVNALLDRILGTPQP